MKEPVLLIMAGGIGSRYGGLKQIDPIDSNNHIIIDYSLYDAHLVGFKSVIFVIKKEMQVDFEEVIGVRIKKYMNVEYAFQCIDDIPEGFQMPTGRTKPWGTAHAVMSARDILNNRPFCVINADDYYGRTAFTKMYEYLSQSHKESEHAMIGYRIGNTLTENGHVARGICSVDENNNLTSIVERACIEKTIDGAEYIEDDIRTPLENNTVVSMNFWGFQPKMMEQYTEYFKEYLSGSLVTNPLKCEYYITILPDVLISKGEATIKVMETDDKWYGVTYQKDKAQVMNEISKMVKSGYYPEILCD